MAQKQTKPEKPTPPAEQKTVDPAQLVGRTLTREITPEQINAGRDGQSRGLRRFAEVREIDVDARTVELAFSSEEPVARWFGDEVLDHSKGAVRLDRLNGGAAVLVNHDWDDQVGVVESARIDKDGRGRAVVRFGRSARADEVFQDIVDGIRKHVSVGYMVHKVEVEQRDGEPDKVTLTDWEPYEISMVAVPADQTVGVGRDMGNPPEETPGGATNTRGTHGGDGLPAERSEVRSSDMNEKILRDGQGNLVRAKVDDDGNIVEVLEMIERAGDDARAAERRATEAERTRTRTIMEMGEQYDAEDLAREYVRDNRTPEEMQRALLDHLHTGRNNNPISDDSDIGMSDDEVRRFSFVRAIRAIADPTNRRAQEAAAFEFEASEAAAQRMGREANGIMIPSDVLTRAINTSTSGAAAGDTGGYSVATDLLSQSFIEMLRNRAVLMRLATPLGGLEGNVDIPSQESGASGYWIGEDSDATEDGLELGQRAMNPKTVAAYSEITRRLLKQSSLDVEALVRRDLATALALAIDKAGFYGSGNSNEPLGIKNYNGINAVDFGGAASGGGSALPTFAEVVQMETAISADNADVNSMAYVMGSGMRGHFKTTEKFDASNGSTIWEPGNTVNGYRSEVTNQITVGDLFFGNFADLIVGMWGGLDITADPYSGSKKGRLRIVTMQDVDFTLRHVESMCYGSDAT